MLKAKRKLTKEEQIKLYLEEIAPRLEEGMGQAYIAQELGYSIQQIQRAIYASNEINKQLVAQGIDPKQFHSGWIKVEGYSMYIQNKEDDSFDKEELIKEMKKHAPKYPKLKRGKCKDGHLLIIDPADIHIGKLASLQDTDGEYNSRIAIKRVNDGIDNLLAKSEGITLEKIVLVIGNDVIHTDGPSHTTTKGTKQDTDTAWHNSFKLAREMYVDIIERLVTLADVHIVYNISNHDATLGFTLADSIYCWFSKNKNVTFDISARDRKYFQFGNSMIMTSHGDGAREKDVPHLAATEEPQMWADTKHRYAYLHHIHHYKKIWVRGGEDDTGFTIEYLRSPSSADQWHYSKGFKSPMAIEGFIHSKDSGQVMKITNYF